jgi:hypothetical protein
MTLLIDLKSLRVELAKQDLRQQDLAGLLEEKLNRTVPVTTLGSWLRGVARQPDGLRDAIECVLRLPTGALRPAKPVPAQ